MTVFYLCPAVERPIGGVKQIYRHVEVLARAGLDARVLLPRGGFRPDWFSQSAPAAWWRMRHRTRVLLEAHDRLPGAHRIVPSINPLLPEGLEAQILLAEGGQTSLTAEDVLVIPEYLGGSLARRSKRARVVLFNQNAYNTFRGHETLPDSANNTYMDGVDAALVVSEHNQRYLGHAFPFLRVILTRNGVDEELFCPRPKERRIAYMPRKLPHDLREVLHILDARGRLRGWELSPIENASEAEVAELLGRAAIFLSTSTREGFGLPALEAGLCGCVVIGYTGCAGAEFMSPAHCYPVPQEDVLAFAQTVEEVLTRFETSESAELERGARFAASLRGRYSREAEATGIVAAWRELLEPDGGGLADVVR